MKSLSSFVTEALFETRFATGEIVQFFPQSSQLSEYNLESAWLVGTIDEIIIGTTGQYYNIISSGQYFPGIPEGQVKQEINTIFTRK